MDSDEAKFALLLREMEAIQDGIQSMDSAMFKIKGWCITIAAAATGVAVSSDHSSFVLIGIGITLAFWFVDAYFKGIQRVYIDRDLEIGRAVAGRDPIAVLNADPNAGGIQVPALARHFELSGGTPTKTLALELRRALREIGAPIVSLLYLFVLLGLIIAFTVLAV